MATRVSWGRRPEHNAIPPQLYCWAPGSPTGRRTRGGALAWRGNQQKQESPCMAWESTDLKFHAAQFQYARQLFETQMFSKERIWQPSAMDLSKIDWEQSLLINPVIMCWIVPLVARIRAKKKKDMQCFANSLFSVVFLLILLTKGRDCRQYFQVK